jgi:hypothetical protein
MKVLSAKITLAIACVISTGGVFGQPTSAWANPESPLTPAQAQHLSRDLIPSRSQNFFQEGQERLEREILILRHRQHSEQEPILQIRRNNKIDQLPQADIESLPSLLPSNQEF